MSVRTIKVYSTCALSSAFANRSFSETGFCGYGDSCKFLHDRGDYLAGWQLDKLAVNPTTGQAAADDSDDDEEVPFACLICRQPFTDPIVTKCGHYFCMK